MDLPPRIVCNVNRVPLVNVITPSKKPDGEEPPNIVENVIIACVVLLLVIVCGDKAFKPKAFALWHFFILLQNLKL